jgi:hypothetical protein
MTMNEQGETLEITISEHELSVKLAGRQIAIIAIIALTLLGVLYLCVIH